MKRLFIIFCILAGMHVGAKAQVINPDGSNMFGFSEITNPTPTHGVQRAIIYCSQPRTVTFQFFPNGFNGTSNVVGYLKITTSGYTNDTNWTHTITNNNVSTKTFQLNSGMNYIEFGLHAWVPYSGVAMILYIQSHSPQTQPGEGVSGTTAGMNTALTVSIY